MMVIYSGSGLSAASGVPTFRGAGGLYEGLRAEEVLSASNFRSNPEQVEAFHDRLAATVAQAQPNAAHLGIAALVTKYPTLVITQNVDDLLERAGVETVIHLHGELALYRCRNNPTHPKQRAVRPWADTMRCPTCNARLRSDVVLFGEPAPAYEELYAVLEVLGPADSIAVIGTQGNVVPIGQLLAEVRATKVLNNLHPSEHLSERAFDHVIYRSAPAAWEEVRQHLTRTRT